MGAIRERKGYKPKEPAVHPTGEWPKGQPTIDGFGVSTIGGPQKQPLTSRPSAAEQTAMAANHFIVG